MNVPKVGENIGFKGSKNPKMEYAWCVFSTVDCKRLHTCTRKIQKQEIWLDIHKTVKTFVYVCISLYRPDKQLAFFSVSLGLCCCRMHPYFISNLLDFCYPKINCKYRVCSSFFFSFWREGKPIRGYKLLHSTQLYTLMLRDTTQTFRANSGHRLS